MNHKPLNHRPLNHRRIRITLGVTSLAAAAALLASCSGGSSPLALVVAGSVKAVDATSVAATSVGDTAGCIAVPPPTTPQVASTASTWAPPPR